MTKFKKLLLTLAPISAIAVATPIILTSCSTNAVDPNDPQKKPDKDNDKENWKIEPDSTNKNEFIPTTSDGLFKSVESQIKTGKKGEEEQKIIEAFKAYTDPKKEDVIDAINMWSFNKWVEASKINGVKYASNLSITNVVKNDKQKEAQNATWDISFSYKFQIIINNSDNDVENILAEKSYSISKATLTDKVAFNTEAKLFEVNGKSILESNSSSLFDAKADETILSEHAKKVKEFLYDKNSNFDSKNVFKSFINNKGIAGESDATAQVNGNWSDSIDKQAGVELLDDKKTIKVNLVEIDSNKKWYELSKDSTKEDVQKAIYIESTDKQTKNLTDTFKKLVVGNEKYKSMTVVEEVIDKDKHINFTITLTNEKDEKSTLKLEFSNYKEDAPQQLVNPIWKADEINKDQMLKIDTNTNIVNLTLTNKPAAGWGNSKSDMTYNQIKTIFEKQEFKTKIISLIDEKDYQINNDFIYSKEIKGQNSSDMDITIKFIKKPGKKAADELPSLIFKVKNFKLTK